MMFKKTSVAFVALLSMFATLTSVGFAQSEETGIPPLGASSTAGGGIDTIDLYSLNIHSEIPLRSLLADVFLYHDQSTLSGKNRQVAGKWILSSTPHVYAISGSNCALDGTLYNTIVDAHGTSHYVPGLCIWSGTPSTVYGPVSFEGWRFAQINSIPGAIDPAGNWFPNSFSIPPADPSGASGSAIDTNGNTTTSTIYLIPDNTNGGAQISGSLTDVAGATVVSGNNVKSSQPTLTYVDASGNTKTITLYYSLFSTSDYFACPNDTFSSNTNILLTKVQLADGSTFQFTYEPTPGHAGYTTGRLASMVLPTGGTVNYSYFGGTNGVNCIDKSTSGLQKSTADGTWTYTHTAPACYNCTQQNITTTTVTAPSADYEVYTFASNNDNLPRYLINKVSYAANGTTLATTTICYNGNTSSCGTNPPTITGLTERKIYSYVPGVASPAVTDSTYSTGLLTETKIFDFGASSPSSDTLITYGTYSSGTCSAISTTILNRPCTAIIKDSAGNIKAQTNRGYDANGNLVTESRLVSGSTYLATTQTYNPNGTLATTTDPKGTVYKVTSYDCGGFLPHTIIAGSLPAETLNHNCTGEKVTSSVDVNGASVSYQYGSDPFWLPVTIVDPLNATTSLRYSPTTSEGSLTFNAGASINDSLSTVDGLGRKIDSQIRKGPSSTNYDTQSFAYDSNGRLSQKSIPCQTTASALCSFTPSTMLTYDGLDRPLVTTDAGGGTVTYAYQNGDVTVTLGPAPANENVKKRQYEYNGLGQLVSVCEITTASGSSSCGQRTAATGFLTSYGYDTLGHVTSITQGSQTRSFTYDDLGRLKSETHPESGPTVYSYDQGAGTGCIASNGDLVSKLDANGNRICYQYDSLHRLTVQSVLSGPNAAATYNKFFVYDSATVNGFTMSNGLGRMVEAYTGSAASKVTDLGFSYNARGDAATLFEKAPDSGYYSVSMGYWDNGLLNTLSGLGLPTLTYGVDAQGRHSTVSASSGQNPVTAVTYGTRGIVTGLTFGSGDTAAFTIDGPTGRMKSYSETINGSTISGTLTWRANGTLGQLAINDPFNAANTQTCTFLHDDLARIGNKPGDTTHQSVDCGTDWQQKFTYDRYGNITKSGSMSWQPGYNAANNHYTLAGTSYDANGNLLNDTFNTYTWDADGHPVTIGSTSITYDAFGRQVEITNGTSHTYEIYALGKRLALKGSTDRIAVPLPGGTQAIYQSVTLLKYFVPDWQGSFRIGSNPARTYGFSVAFAPFGERYDNSGTPFDYAFAGNSNDANTNMYDTAARKMHSSQGRWVSPDLANAFALRDPQSFNKYVYARNNPLELTDTSGNDANDPNGGYNASNGIDNGVSQIYYDAGDGMIWILDEVQINPVFENTKSWEFEEDLGQAQLIMSVFQPPSQDETSVSNTNGISPLPSGMSLADVSPVLTAPSNIGTFGVRPFAQAAHTFGFVMYRADPIGVLGLAAPMEIGVVGTAEGFGSFTSFKRAYGAAGESQQWHHIVEQTPGNLARFGAPAVHSPENLVKMPTEIHQQISAYYSTKQEFAGGLTVRQWLSNQPLEAQRVFGLRTMQKFGAPMP